MIKSIGATSGAVVTLPADQEAIWFLGALSVLRVSGEHTGGAFSITETFVRRGAGSPVHIHDRDDETFVVLEGELRIIVGDEDYTAGPGALAVLPCRVPHAYVVNSPTARFFVLHTPSGFEDFEREVGEPAPTLELPPETEQPADLELLTEIAARHGLTIVGPPPRPAVSTPPPNHAPGGQR